MFLFFGFSGGSILRAGRNVAHRFGLVTTKPAGEGGRRELERRGRKLQEDQVSLAFGWGNLCLYWTVSALIIEPLDEVWITIKKMFSGSTKVECNVFAFFARGTYAWVSPRG